jgi:hypothetical protein
MRALAILVLITLAMPVYAEEAARNDGAFLYEACLPLANAAEDLSDLSPSNLWKVGYCIGYTTSQYTTLQRLHSRWYATREGYGDMANTNSWGEQWAASQVVVGPDSCFPGTIRPKTIAMILTKEAREHPEQLTLPMLDFAQFALSEAFPCFPKQK